MRLSDISTKINNALDKFRRGLSSPEESLGQMEEFCDESIDSLDQIERKLSYYARDAENVKNERMNEISLYGLNERVKNSTGIVQNIYGSYRRQNPLLTGEEDYYSFGARYEKNDGSARFNRKVKEHLSFIRSMKSVFKQSLSEIEDAREELRRQQYDKKAAEQRDEDYKIDKSEVIPEMTPEKVRSELSEMLREELREEQQAQEQEEEEEDMNLMTSRQFVHYIIELLKSRKGERSDYYQILKDGFPEQAEKIERRVSSTRSLDYLDYDEEGIIGLSDREITYIKQRVNENRQPDETLEELKEKYREKELER